MYRMVVVQFLGYTVSRLAIIATKVCEEYVLKIHNQEFQWYTWQGDQLG